MVTSRWNLVRGMLFVNVRFLTSGRRFKAVGITVVAIALVASACANPAAESGNEDSPTTVASSIGLTDVSLESSSVEEMDPIRFSGLDTASDLSNLELQIIVDDLDPMDSLLFADDIGVFAIAPLHPVSPGDGGPMTLRLSDGSNGTRDFDIELTGLPPAPGAWDDATDAILGELEARATQLGTSLAELSNAAMDDVGPDEAVVKFVAGFMDDGTTSDIGSLPVQPGEEFSAEQAALLDSVVAKLSLGQMNLPPLEVATADAFAPGAATVALRGTNSKVTAIRAGLAQSTSCRKKVIPITNGGELKAALAEGIQARNALNDGFFSDSNDYLISNALTLTGVAAGAFAVTGVGAPAAAVVGGVSTAAGAMYATQRLALLADASNYPSMFTNLNVEVSHSEFNEDFTKDGQITSVKVVAASTGFNGADALSGVGAAIADGALGMGVGRAAKGVSENVLGGTLAMSEPLRQTAQGKTLASLGSEYLEFCPQQWSVPITDSQYVRAWTVNNVIAADTTALSYKPEKVGSDILWVETRPDYFIGASAITDTPIEVLTLGVSANPYEIKVKKAGETVDLTGIMDNADTLEAAWETEAGEWADGLGDVTDFKEVTRRLATPTDKKQYPFEIKITSLSKTGLRAQQSDERFVTVTVRLRKLIISPDPGGVLVKKDLQFTATDDEGKPRDVTWKGTGGDIDPSTGLYTAGKIPGTYSVTATATDDNNVTETVDVKVTDECLVGTWVLRSMEFFQQISAQSPKGDVKYRSGENRMVIRDDGTYTSYRIAWSFETSAPQGTVIGIIDAENVGSWQATDTEISINESGGTPESVQLFVEVGGQMVSIPGVGNTYTFSADALSTQAAYTCEDDVMTSTSSGVTSIFDRVD